MGQKFMGEHIQSIDNKIISRIYGHDRGWVFTPADFSDLGSRDAVASALRRHRRSGRIRQLARGVYDYPRTDPDLGMLTQLLDQMELLRREGLSDCLFVLHPDCI